MLTFAVENKNNANEFKEDAEKVVESEEREKLFLFLFVFTFINLKILKL